MKRRPDWWSGVRSITQFSGYIDGGAHSAHSLPSSRSRGSSSSRHAKKRARSASGWEENGGKKNGTFRVVIAQC